MKFKAADRRVMSASFAKTDAFGQLPFPFLILGLFQSADIQKRAGLWGNMTVCVQSGSIRAGRHHSVQLPYGLQSPLQSGLTQEALSSVSALHTVSMNSAHTGSTMAPTTGNTVPSLCSGWKVKVLISINFKQDLELHILNNSNIFFGN